MASTRRPDIYRQLHQNPGATLQDIRRGHVLDIGLVGRTCGEAELALLVVDRPTLARTALASTAHDEIGNRFNEGKGLSGFGMRALRITSIPDHGIRATWQTEAEKVYRIETGSRRLP